MEGGGRHAGVTLESVLGKEKDMSLKVNRTLLDIIRQEEPNCRVYENIINSQNRKGWKLFKEKRRSDGGVWAERVPVTLSDVAFREDMVSSSNDMAMGVGCETNQRLPLAQLLRAQSARVVEQLPEEDVSGDVPLGATGEVQSLNQYLSRENELEQENSLHIEHVLGSVAIAPTVNRSSSMLTPNTSHIPSAGQPDMSVSSVRLSEALAAERQHMQTVISSTEAPRSARNETETDVFETNNHSEERVQIDAEVANEQPQVRMSLMDLLEETDNRQLGGSSYSMGVYDHTGIIDEGNDYVEEEGSNFVDRNCCVCMVRHKGSAFIPCGHTFCRLCSRELWVKRGNCPICNGFILEILDIF